MKRKADLEQSLGGSNGSRSAEPNAARQTRILIVEDEPAMVAGLRDNFEYEGYDVISAADGIEGLDRALADDPDLVVLDVMMPRLSGLDVCKQLKTRKPALPIIMLTARGQEIDKVVGLELGADDYVTKPFSIRELMARVKAVLRRASPHAPAAEVYRFSDVEINVRSNEVLRAGQPVELSAKEFALLAYFVCWTRCGVMRIIRTRGQWTHTSSISGRNWNRILRSRGSF